MKLFHINHDKTRLLIFFCGFYTNAESFAEFDNATSDILFVYDYSDLDFSELEYFDFSFYAEINLIAYSWGVFAANIGSGFLPPLDKKVAISGTIFPIHDTYGIPLKIVDLMLNNFNEDVVLNFKNKMELNSNCNIKAVKRTVENLKEEMISIKNYVLSHEIRESLNFDFVVITKKDKIFSYKNQINFWAGHNNILELDMGHFPFFYFENFDKILEYC